jgi:hypothetical protein
MISYYFTFFELNCAFLSYSLGGYWWLQDEVKKWQELGIKR